MNKNNILTLIVVLMSTTIFGMHNLGYVEHHAQIVTECARDPINYENLCGEKSIVLRQGKKNFVAYDVDSAYEIFVSRKLDNPLTRERIPRAQLNRIALYKEYAASNPPHYGDDEIRWLFRQVTMAITLTAPQRLALRRLLNLHHIANNLDRTSVSRRLHHVELGSWMLRTSSLPDNHDEKIEVKTLSIKCDERTTWNTKIFHAWGYGFCVESAKASVTSWNDVDLSSMVCFASLLEVLEWMGTTDRKLDLTKYRD